MIKKGKTKQNKEQQDGRKGNMSDFKMNQVALQNENHKTSASS